jgi:hypothetical protein
MLDTNSASANMNVIQVLLNNYARVYYAPQHGPPVVSLPGDWLVPANEISSMSFSVSDDLTPGNYLVLSVRSSNPGLVTAEVGPTPLSAFAASSVKVPNPPSIPGWNGYLNLTARPNQTGAATLL